MSDFGVLSTGFARKPLSTILAEIEESLIGTFGPAIIQTPQSPMGQINGLFADATAQLWELAEDTYQSYDPDQAEGIRLDALSKIRLLARATDEADAELRQAITNAGRARIDIQDLLRAIQNVSGVTYAQAFVNDAEVADENGLDPHSVALSVLGGDDEEVALTLRTYVVPGIGTSGNVRVDTNRDGFCRTVWISRPTPIPITVNVEVIRRTDRLGCPPAALLSIAEGLVLDLNGSRRLINGEDVTVHIIRSAIEARYSNVEVVSVAASRAGDSVAPIEIDFNEIASFSIENVTVENA